MIATIIGLVGLAICVVAIMGIIEEARETTMSNDIQARLDRAITSARRAVIAWWSEPAIDHYAALVALRARLVAHLDYCTEKRCEETTELTAEAERLLGEDA